MTTHYISTLGVAKCREILSGAPDKCVVNFSYDDDQVVYFDDAGNYWDEDYQDWFEIYFSMPDLMGFSDLRTELSAHDTDSCTDIRNHLSPNTVVVG